MDDSAVGSGLSVHAKFDCSERNRNRALYGQCAVNVDLAKAPGFCSAVFWGELFERPLIINAFKTHASMQIGAR